MNFALTEFSEVLAIRYSAILRDEVVYRRIQHRLYSARRFYATRWRTTIMSIPHSGIATTGISHQVGRRRHVVAPALHFLALIHLSAWNIDSAKFTCTILHSRPHTPESASPDTPHSPGPLGLVTPVDRYAGLWMRQMRKLMSAVVCSTVCPLSRVCLNRTAGLPPLYRLGRLDAAFDGVVNFVKLRHREVRLNGVLRSLRR
jgi:hypothetical protein